MMFELIDIYWKAVKPRDDSDTKQGTLMVWYLFDHCIIEFYR